MLALRAQFIDTKLGYHFRKPSFRVAVLFVDENEVKKNRFSLKIFVFL